MNETGGAGSLGGLKSKNSTRKFHSPTQKSGKGKRKKRSGTPNLERKNPHGVNHEETLQGAFLRVQKEAGALLLDLPVREKSPPGAEATNIPVVDKKTCIKIVCDEHQERDFKVLSQLEKAVYGNT